MKKILKILGVLFVICIVGVGLVLWIGGRDASEPDLSGLVPKENTVPEDQNAFPHLMAAASAFKPPRDPSAMVAYINDRPVHEKMIADFLESNAPVFKKMDKVLTFEQCQAPEGKDASYISQWYQVAILFAVRSAHARKAGRFSESTDAAIALIHLGDMIHPDAKYIADYTAGTKILQLGLEEVDFIVHSESVASKDLHRLADTLAELKTMNQGLASAIKNKYLTVAESIDSFRSRKKSLEQSFDDTYNLPYILRKTTWYPAYMFKENETKGRLAVLYRDMAANVQKNYADMKSYDLEQFLGLVGSRYRFYLSPNFVGRIFYAFTTPEFQSFLDGKFQLDGTARAMRLLVALKLFERENGALPERLEALCPTYLPNVPVDPFDGKPFRYSRDKELIYSVSKDLKDSGGSVTVPPDEIYGKDYPKTWIAEDGVFYIKK